MATPVPTAGRSAASGLPTCFRRLDRTAPVWGLTAILLVLLVCLPIGWVLIRSLQDPFSGALTLKNYIRAFTNSRYLAAVWATVKMAGLVGVLAVSAGSVMGWLVARTDVPLRRFLRAMVVASFVTPPFLGAFAWTLLAGPNAGELNQLYRTLTGREGYLINIYSLGGLAFVIFLYVYPYVFTLITNSLELISSDVEEAANILGAPGWRVAATITLPLVLPAILGGFILSFVQSFALFGAPAILAMPAGFHTVTTQIWALFQFPPEIEVAAALAAPMLVLTGALLWLQRRVLGRRGYATVVGKSVQRRRVELGRWRWLALAFCLLVILLAVGLPYYILLKAALSKAWAEPLSRENFTLGNFRFVLTEYSSTQAAIKNSLVLGALSATAAAILAGFIAYIVKRGLVRGAKVLEYLATAPVVVPGIVLAVGLFIAYTRPPFLLYGTIWILFLAYLTKELPIAFTHANTTFGSIHPELEEASRMLGASRLRALRDVTAPLAKNGLVAAWCFVFIGAIRELSASILLFTSRSKVVSVVIYDLKEEGMWGAISVLGILLLAATFLIVAIAQRYSGREYLSTRGG